MEVLGFKVTKTDSSALSPSAKWRKNVTVDYELRGPRGAHYGLIRNAHRPHMLFVVNLKQNCFSVPSVRGYGWFSDESGSLEPVNY